MTRTSRVVAQLAAFAGVVAALVAGLLGLGRSSDNATPSMGLTAAWFGVGFGVVAVTSARRFVDLGALKGNVGDQQYSLPSTADTERPSTVVVWCRAFSVAFTSAPLRPS